MRPGSSFLAKNVSGSHHHNLICLPVVHGRLCSTTIVCSPTGSKVRERMVVSAAKHAGKETQDISRYKSTIELPKTNFSLKANSVTREPEIQQLWDQKQVLRKLHERCNGEPYTLHDGPPYANGDLHTGHALNKILKDFINRYQLLQGRKVCFIPGWDCHGLPIELKVLQSMDAEARENLTPIKLRKKAAQFAIKTVDQQRNSFKRYGIWADWENPYLTLAPEYEAAQIGVFGQMVLKGYIYRGRKPVHWSPSSGTALAEAELEYPEGHISRSIYAVFKLCYLSETFPESLKGLLPNLGLAIWTTTPWTIPGNAGVAVNDKLSYSVVEISSKGEAPEKLKKGKQKHGSGLTSPQIRYLVVASDLVSALEQKWDVSLRVLGAFMGAAIEHSRYEHPLDGRECPVVVGGEYITTESGTGLVHTAPGHGQEDFVTGRKYGLPLLSPVDDNGIFTEEAGGFAGLNVLGDGNDAVVKALDAHSSLLMEEAYAHKYPYDWRTKKPTIFRLTEQWFASVEGFKKEALKAISEVKWTPSQGQNRITTMVAGRSDWCISRQRAWGVPIPVFYDVETGEPLLNQETITHVQSIIAKKGSDAWWYMDVKDLLPEVYKDSSDKYRKGTDTMDVWFDSGSSWAAVLGKRDGVRWPADLYLEGSDQHRGWFQSSLLTSIATTGMPPYKEVITHGFVLDEKGTKMSKSVGNVIDPRIVIEGGKDQKTEPGYGADVLRLWVASVDYTGDVLIGPQILKQTSEGYRKLRATLRYLLSNLHDWTPKETVSYENLPMVDKYALFQLSTTMEAVQEAFVKYQFFKFFQVVQRYVIVDLSNFYFDIAKDRLYVGGKSSHARRSCQTVLAAQLLCLVRGIAPVLPHLAEDAWQHLPFQFLMEDGLQAETAFEARWPKIDKRWRVFSEKAIIFWTSLLQIRTEVNKVLESARIDKLIGANLDAKVYLYLDNEDISTILLSMSGTGEDADRLHRIFLTSQVEILHKKEAGELLNLPYKGSFKLEGIGEMWVGVSRAEGNKCERCWCYSQEVGSLHMHPTLCRRCHSVVVELENSEKNIVAAV